MSDQGRWFKLWVSSPDDPHLDNLDIADYGRWAKFGTYLKEHGTGGKITLAAPCRALQAKFQVSTFDAVLACIEKFPNCASHRVTDAPVTYVVEWRNWQKYQEDNSAERTRKWREKKHDSVTHKKRREEKRREETPPSKTTEAVVSISPGDDAFLAQCPEPFRSAWRDGAWWLSLLDGYEGLDIQSEASKYMAWWGARTAGHQHKNVRSGLRNWLAKAAMWRETRQMREAVRTR